MKTYKTTDYSGLFSIHYANNEEEAIKKHYIHFSLDLNEKIKVEELKEIKKEDIPLICRDVYCCCFREEL